MTTLITIGIIAAAAVALAAWLKRAVKPVLIGYETGFKMGRLDGDRDRDALARVIADVFAPMKAVEPDSRQTRMWRGWTAEVAMAWLMPWRAVRRQRQTADAFRYVLDCVIEDDRRRTGGRDQKPELHRVK